MSSMALLRHRAVTEAANRLVRCLVAGPQRECVPAGEQHGAAKFTDTKGKECSPLMGCKRPNY